MQVISVTDTNSGVKVSHRAFPAGLRALFYAAMLAFVGFVLVNADLANESWLPPLDQMPAWAKSAVLFGCIGAGVALLLWPIVRGLKILLWGEVWEFETARQLVTRDGKVVLPFGEIRTLRIEADTSDAPSTVTLSIATRAGRTIRIADGTVHRQLEGFLDVARRVQARVRIPCEKVGIPRE